VRVFWLGRVPYDDALDLQRAVADARRDRLCGDTLLLLEHPPTITLGRAAKAEHILAAPDRLRDAGIAVRSVGRGGDVTYHGPGQLVGYPIIDLAERGRDLHGYLRSIEQALIDALRALGVEARRFPPHTGVWIGEAKVAAIGVRVSRWVTTHGFALNVALDLAAFDLIVPCGIHEYSVTSLERETGARWSVETVLPAIAREFGEAFGGCEAGSSGAGNLLPGAVELRTTIEAAARCQA
jgi:lipoyl(octanoyl) transferase